MSTNNKGWQKLFLFCLGLFAGTAFCMKWMEGDFVYSGKAFTIIGLELTYSKQEVANIAGGVDGTVWTILQYHLYFDFAFMLGVYPGIIALCMIGRNKSRNFLARRILSILAILQVVAWGCDITENWFLLQWMQVPLIGKEFTTYHVVVYIKWILALSGALVAIPFAIRKRKAADATI